MGIKDWFSRKPAGLSIASAPSNEYPTARSAIEGMLRAHPDLKDDGCWVTFTAESAGRSAIIEITGDQVNFCKVQVDLAALLRASGLNALAASARPGGRKQEDRTCWTVPDAKVDELVEIVDVAFIKAFGLGESYSVSAEYRD